MGGGAGHLKKVKVEISPVNRVIYKEIKYHCMLHANSRSLKLHGSVVITILTISIACTPPNF